MTLQELSKSCRAPCYLLLFPCKWASDLVTTGDTTGVIFGLVCLCVCVCLSCKCSDFWERWPGNFIYCAQLLLENIYRVAQNKIPHRRICNISAVRNHWSDFENSWSCLIPTLQLQEFLKSDHWSHPVGYLRLSRSSSQGCRSKKVIGT